jgi:hypothetical protein
VAAAAAAVVGLSLHLLFSILRLLSLLLLLLLLLRTSRTAAVLLSGCCGSHYLGLKGMAVKVSFHLQDSTPVGVRLRCTFRSNTCTYSCCSRFSQKGDTAGPGLAVH